MKNNSEGSLYPSIIQFSAVVGDILRYYSTTSQQHLTLIESSDLISFCKNILSGHYPRSKWISQYGYH